MASQDLRRLLFFTSGLLLRLWVGTRSKCGTCAPSYTTAVLAVDITLVGMKINSVLYEASRSV